MTTNDQDRYFKLTRRAGILCSGSVISSAALGAGSDYLNQVAPWLLNLMMPLSLLVALVSAVICVVAAVALRLKRQTDATPEPNRQTTQVLWLLAASAGVSLVAAVFDDRIQGIQSIRGFGRSLGPLAALLGSVLSVLLGLRFRDRRFAITCILSTGLTAYWVWRFVRM